MLLSGDRFADTHHDDRRHVIAHSRGELCVMTSRGVTPRRLFATGLRLMMWNSCDVIDLQTSVRSKTENSIAAFMLTSDQRFLVPFYFLKCVVQSGVSVHIV